MQSIKHIFCSVYVVQPFDSTTTLKNIFFCQNFVHEDFGYFNLVFRCFISLTEMVASAREDAFTIIFHSNLFCAWGHAQNRRWYGVGGDWDGRVVPVRLEKAGRRKNKIKKEKKKKRNLCLARVGFVRLPRHTEGTQAWGRTADAIFLLLPLFSLWYTESLKNPPPYKAYLLYVGTLLWFWINSLYLFSSTISTGLRHCLP